MHTNNRLVLVPCLFLWLLGLLQHSFAQDQPPTASTAATDPLLLNATKIIPYNASLSRPYPRSPATPSQPAPDTVLKTVYTCSGGINDGPNNDCRVPCTMWRNWIDNNKVQDDQKGTNCIDTDCNTGFTVCNAKDRAFKHVQQCTDWNDLTPHLTPWGRCCYDVPGTDYITLWL